MYRGATLGARVDPELSLHQFDSLLHADKTKPSAIPCCFGVKADPGIAHSEMDCTRVSEKFHFELPGPAVLRRVL